VITAGSALAASIPHLARALSVSSAREAPPKQAA